MVTCCTVRVAWLVNIVAGKRDVLDGRMVSSTDRDNSKATDYGG